MSPVLCKSVHTNSRSEQTPSSIEREGGIWQCHGFNQRDQVTLAITELFGQFVAQSKKQQNKAKDRFLVSKKGFEQQE
jgi:hypothetical protein